MPLTTCVSGCCLARSRLVSLLSLRRPSLGGSWPVPERESWLFRRAVIRAKPNGCKLSPIMRSIMRAIWWKPVEGLKIKKYQIVQKKLNTKKNAISYAVVIKIKLVEVTPSKRGLLYFLSKKILNRLIIMEKTWLATHATL